MAVTVTPKTLQHFSRLSRDQSSDRGRVPAITRQAIALARVTLTPEEGGAIALADTLHYSARMRKGYAHSTLRRILIGLPIAMLASAPSLADRIVDPKTVAPEFREAAEKRRAEQVKLIECNNAARIAKIPPRDMAHYVAECFDKPADKPQ